MMSLQAQTQQTNVCRQHTKLTTRVASYNITATLRVHATSTHRVNLRETVNAYE